MNIGFKTGTRNFELGQKIVKEDKASFCELWFNVTDLPPYDEIIDWLSARDVKMGLHHWGLVDGEYKPNLSSKNSHVRDTAIEQIKQTIDIASEIDAVYVNAHPGTETLEKMNFDTAEQELIDDERATQEEANELLFAGVQELQQYAQKKEVVLTIETLPGRELLNYEERRGLYNPGNPSLSVMENIASQGVFIANDITHTAGQAALVDNHPDAMWENIMKFTETVKKQTKLLHINTVVPPYNGSDSHGGILDSDFETERFPSRDQLKEFLQLFKERDDVFVIPEPKDDMQGNYRALVALANSL